jgi:hypothetical protein
MSKYVGIWIFAWIAFKVVFHAITYDLNDVASLVYFVSNDFIYVGIFWSIHSMVDKLRIKFFRVPTYKVKRLLKVVLIYSICSIIINVLIFYKVGAPDSSIYTNIDIGILTAGTIWAIFV